MNWLIHWSVKMYCTLHAHLQQKCEAGEAEERTEVCSMQYLATRINAVMLFPTSVSNQGSD